MIIIPQGDKGDKINLIEAFLKAFLFFALQRDQIQQVLLMMDWMRRQPGDMMATCQFQSEPTTETVSIRLDVSFSKPPKAANT